MEAFQAAPVHLEDPRSIAISRQKKRAGARRLFV